jgi:L-aminopeptidase/D-esterase-like protein
VDNDTLTSVAGIRVGHWTDARARTGCTVVLTPDGGCVGSGLVLGPAPGSRETALLEPDKTVDRIDALLLTGGSAFGLAAADGVMAFLSARDRGLPTPFARVPIVPAAALYDLGVGVAEVRPDAAAGRAACEAAASPDGAAAVTLGRVGAGAGATVGKLAGFERAVASGLGSAAMTLRGARVAALAVSNAVGNLIDPRDGSLVAGVAGLGAVEIAELFAPPPGTNTSLVAVATDAPIDKAQARALAQSAHVGIARVTRPSHTVHDGDTVFVLSTARGPSVPLAALSVAVQEVVAEALLRGAREGRDAAGARPDR